MSLPLHKIDPFGDTIIILRNPCRDFAPWEETSVLYYSDPTETDEDQATCTKSSEDELVVKPKLSKREMKAMKKKRGKASRLESVMSTEEDNGELAQASSEAMPTEQEVVPTEPGTVPTAQRDAHNSEPVASGDSGIRDPSIESAVPIFATTESQNDDVHYLVSSRHLMLASPWFKRALSQHEFSEASKSSSDERYHINASDWDPEALLILLNIFHVRTRQVPATLSLETLAKIAVLVDYYELENAEVMERDIRDWTTNLRHSRPIPGRCCRDLVLWIFVSRVFHMSDEFERATEVAIRTSKGSIPTLGLPIRMEIICTFLTWAWPKRNFHH